LAQELTDGTSEKGRCPNLRTDKVGAYCAKDLNAGELISEMRRMICDTASLQFWCLDSERCKNCIYYLGERIS